MDKFITIPARSGFEAQHGSNDIFPGDPVSVNIGSLAAEAARLCAGRLVRGMEREILSAFLDGFDYVVTELGPLPLDEWQVTFRFNGRRSSPGEFDAGLPIGWTVYRLKDWHDGKR